VKRHEDMTQVILIDQKQKDFFYPEKKESFFFFSLITVIVRVCTYISLLLGFFYNWINMFSPRQSDKNSVADYDHYGTQWMREAKESRQLIEELKSQNEKLQRENHAVVSTAYLLYIKVLRS
jgi:hypothetical protein